MGTKQTLVGVLVTTEYKGVFFGYANKTQKLDAKTIHLKDVRMCVYWSASVKGMPGLAATGPDKQCKISPKCPSMTAQGVTAVFECSQEAIAAWESAPWTR
jgi:hypothetical protein